MSDNELKATFRAIELKRRAVRRADLKAEMHSLTKRLINEGMLVDEVLTPEDQIAHERAGIMLEAQQRRLERLQYPSYWRRLWRALLNQR